jgi:hypothetical protein
MKHLLERTKREFADIFYTLPENAQMDMITTQWRANTQFARWRRIHVKTMNDIYLRELKGQAGHRRPATLPLFLRPAQVEPTPEPARKTHHCKYCPKQFVSLKRRRKHIATYHVATTDSLNKLA